MYSSPSTSCSSDLLMHKSRVRSVASIRDFLSVEWSISEWPNHSPSPYSWKVKGFLSFYCDYVFDSISTSSLIIPVLTMNISKETSPTSYTLFPSSTSLGNIFLPHSTSYSLSSRLKNSLFLRNCKSSEFLSSELRREATFTDFARSCLCISRMCVFYFARSKKAPEESKR